MPNLEDIVMVPVKVSETVIKVVIDALSGK